MGHANVERVHQPGMRLLDQPDPVVAVPRDDFCGRIGGAVVDNDELVAGVSLVKDAVHGGSKESCRVSNRHQDRDLRRSTPVCQSVAIGSSGGDQSTSRSG